MYENYIKYDYAYIYFGKINIHCCSVFFSSEAGRILLFKSLHLLHLFIQGFDPITDQYNFQDPAKCCFQKTEAIRQFTFHPEASLHPACCMTNSMQDISSPVQSLDSVL